MHAAKARRQLLSDINITPLTDVFLVLLIIMMVVAPMLRLTRRDINPPQVDTGQPITTSKLVIEVTKEGSYFVDGKMTPADKLAGAFKAGEAQYKDKDLVIRADKNTKASAVLKIFDSAKEAEFEKMTVVVETLAPSRQEELQKAAQEQPGKTS